MASSKNITKNKMKHPIETAFTTTENSSNLDLINQCWYIPEKENIIIQYKYTTNRGIKKDVGSVKGIQPDSILM